MGHFFISYSHKDKDYVHKLADALQSEGFDVWIDDRIDYGTRWPLVIETAIDSCEAFVLVASENSHNSEWVQHEVARAKRLEKQFFPLLLDGNPWLSFESIQYFDVHDRVLPNEKFYSSLRSYEYKRVEHLRRSVIDNWPVYRNKKHGFSISYPLEGMISEETEEFVRIDLPVLQKTTLRKKHMFIHFRNEKKLSSPFSNSMSILDKTKYINILGNVFLYEGGLEGHMSKLHEWISYSTLRGDKVITLSLMLTSSPRDVFLPQLITAVDLVAEKETLLYTLSTFSWTI